MWTCIKNKLKEVSNIKNLINQFLSKPHNVNDLCCLLHNPAPVQERVPEAEAEDTADVGDYGEGGVDPGALRHLHRRVEHDLDPAVRVRGQHSAGHTYSMRIMEDETLWDILFSPQFHWVNAEPGARSQAASKLTRIEMIVDKLINGADLLVR